MEGGGLCGGCGRRGELCFGGAGIGGAKAEDDGLRVDSEERMLDWVWDDEISRSWVDCEGD